MFWAKRYRNIACIVTVLNTVPEERISLNIKMINSDFKVSMIMLMADVSC